MLKLSELFVLAKNNIIIDIEKMHVEIFMNIMLCAHVEVFINIYVLGLIFLNMT